MGRTSVERFLRLSQMAFFFIVLLGSCGTAFGSVATGFYIRCEFELTDGGSVSGYFETYNNGEYKAPAVTGLVTAPSGINMRDKPSSKGKALKKLPKDTQLIVLSTEGEMVEIEGRKAPWFMVKAGELEGHVFGGFVQVASQSGGGSASDSYTFSEIAGDSGSVAEPVNGEFFMKRFIRTPTSDGGSEESSRTIRVYKEIHALNYSPKRKKDMKCDEIERNSFLGVLDSDVVEIEKSRIGNVRVTGFREGDIAPLLVLKRDELEWLRNPAKALFSVENYPEGVVALISYNDDYNTPEKLETLLRGFIDTKKSLSIPADAGWWYPIYDASSEQEFRKSFLPGDVLMLLYHVSD